MQFLLPATTYSRSSILLHKTGSETFPASTNRTKSVNTQQISTLTVSSKNATCTNFHAVPFPDCLSIPHSIPAAISSHPTRPPTHAHSCQPTFFGHKKEQLAMWETFADTFAQGIFAVKKSDSFYFEICIFGENWMGAGRGGQLPKQRQERFTWCIFSERVQDSPPPLKKYTVKKMWTIIYGRDWIIEKYFIWGKSSDQSHSHRGGRKVRLIDFPIPIRSSDCIGRYNRLMPSSDFCIGRLCRFILSSDFLIVRSCFLVLSSDFCIVRLYRPVLSNNKCGKNGGK